MIDYLRHILAKQFDAALCMLNDCIDKCPPHLWDARVAKYPFWQVAYHALCFVDLYLSPGEASFTPREACHPQGWRELDEEYPSRRFERDEILTYLQICQRKAHEALAAETAASLEAPSGFPGRPATRGELYLYNLRHLQHHVGQLGACLRREDQSLDPRWVGSGWR